MRRAALRWGIGIVIIVVIVIAVIIINAAHSGMTLSAGWRRTSGSSSSSIWRVIPVDAVATVSKRNVVLLVISRVLSNSAGCGWNRRICSHRRGRRGGI